MTPGVNSVENLGDASRSSLRIFNKRNEKRGKTTYENFTDFGEFFNKTRHRLYIHLHFNKTGSNNKRK